jgi:phospholipid transport system substrate-binding protein
MLKKGMLIVMCMCSFYSFAWGEEPTDTLKLILDDVYDVMDDPQYKDPAKQLAQRDKLWEYVPKIFDFVELSKRTLARNWKKFTPEQRKEFSEVFGRFLGDIYLDRIQEGYTGNRFVFLSQNEFAENKVLVETSVKVNAIELPINYKLMNRKNGWKIYDVSIEGVSLVKNYRSQFSKILMKDTPTQLIETLKEKVETHRQKLMTSEIVPNDSSFMFAMNMRCQLNGFFFLQEDTILKMGKPQFSGRII